ncbi:hypothetical protein ANANG_G00002400 [Anguilla anguilla]|uniref:Ig-like domain-containing protein n=1 Tax=Anguilla anguilla TaxID=7936 RepID=A0A9D3MW64_ANGAN|nr:hypothetical protein ANANG_G00002400 [Anguilla anguilla]
MSMCAHGRSPAPRKSRWLCLTVLLLLQQGNWGQITVTQSPSVVVSRLNHNATLACNFSHRPEQKVTGVILYWYHTGPNGQDLSRTSEDKSVVLQNATWRDSQRYRCMLSYETPEQPQRKRGEGVLLLLHDSMTFDLAPGMVSELLCSVKVSPDPGFRLSVFRDGVHVLTAQNHTPAPHVTLSLLVPVAHNAECRLNHSSGFILRKTYSIQQLPEPVLLYVAILLVPFIVLVISLTAHLITTSGHVKSHGVR